jgi:hypothetical protein
MNTITTVSPPLAPLYARLPDKSRPRVERVSGQLNVVSSARLFWAGVAAGAVTLGVTGV